MNGSTIFGDRFVEWVIRDLRTQIGKYSTGSGSSSYVREVALHLNDRKNLAKAMKSSPPIGSPPEKEKYMIRISRVYCETLTMTIDMNLFGVGSPEYVATKSTRVPGPYSNREISRRHRVRS
jgi:hypothetical protein